MNWVKQVKYFILVLSIMTIFGGCGETASTSGSPKDGDNNINNDPNQTQGPFLYRRISIAGSSITHGQTDRKEDGYLGEESYVGAVERYFREEVADTIGPDELAGESEVNPMSYQGTLKIYPEGTILEGTLNASDEIAIVYAGSDTPTHIRLDVDGKSFEYDIPMGNYSPVEKVFDDTDSNNPYVKDFYFAFRQTNPKAVKIWKLPKSQTHQFRLIVLSGELHLNFITNHMYYMQNAGVSGFEVNDFLSEMRPHSTYKDIVAFNPDLFIFESSTNDAKTWSTEIAKSDESTNEWLLGAEDPVSFTIAAKTLTIPYAISVQQGDVVIMGNYQGDIQNMAVGIVANSTNSQHIKLSKIILYQNQKAQEVERLPENIDRICRIKRIKSWEERVKRVVSKVVDGVEHKVVVGIGTSGVPNYYKPGTHAPESEPPFTPRRLLGYREKAIELAKENGWFFVDFFQQILQVEPGVDEAKKWSIGDNTHPNAQGRSYFGQAVIDALKSL